MARPRWIPPAIGPSTRPPSDPAESAQKYAASSSPAFTEAAPPPALAPAPAPAPAQPQIHHFGLPKSNTTTNTTNPDFDSDSYDSDLDEFVPNGAHMSREDRHAFHSRQDFAIMLSTTYALRPSQAPSPAAGAGTAAGLSNSARSAGNPNSAAQPETETEAEAEAETEAEAEAETEAEAEAETEAEAEAETEAGKENARPPPPEGLVKRRRIQLVQHQTPPQTDNPTSLSRKKPTTRQQRAKPGTKPKPATKRRPRAAPPAPARDPPIMSPDELLRSARLQTVVFKTPDELIGRKPPASGHASTPPPRHLVCLTERATARAVFQELFVTPGTSNLWEASWRFTDASEPWHRPPFLDANIHNGGTPEGYSLGHIRDGLWHPQTGSASLATSMFASLQPRLPTSTSTSTSNNPAEPADDMPAPNENTLLPLHSVDLPSPKNDSDRPSLARKEMDRLACTLSSPGLDQQHRYGLPPSSQTKAMADLDAEPNRAGPNPAPHAIPDSLDGSIIELVSPEESPARRPVSEARRLPPPAATSPKQKPAAPPEVIAILDSDDDDGDVDDDSDNHNNDNPFSDSDFRDSCRRGTPLAQAQKRRAPLSAANSAGLFPGNSWTEPPSGSFDWDLLEYIAPEEAARGELDPGTPTAGGAGGAGVDPFDLDEMEREIASPSAVTVTQLLRQARERRGRPARPSFSAEQGPERGPERKRKRPAIPASQDAHVASREQEGHIVESNQAPADAGTDSAGLASTLCPQHGPEPKRTISDSTTTAATATITTAPTTTTSTTATAATATPARTAAPTTVPDSDSDFDSDASMTLPELGMLMGSQQMRSRVQAVAPTLSLPAPAPAPAPPSQPRVGVPENGRAGEPAVGRDSNSSSPVPAPALTSTRPPPAPPAPPAPCRQKGPKSALKPPAVARNPHRLARLEQALFPAISRAIEEEEEQRPESPGQAGPERVRTWQERILLFEPVRCDELAAWLARRGVTAADYRRRTKKEVVAAQREKKRRMQAEQKKKKEREKEQALNGDKDGLEEGPGDEDEAEDVREGEWVAVETEVTAWMVQRWCDSVGVCGLLGEKWR